MRSLTLITTLLFSLSLLAGPMAISKSDISLILSSFKDKEGAIIKKIQRVENGIYEVDIITKLKKCHRNKVKIDRKKKKALFDTKVDACD